MTGPIGDAYQRSAEAWRLGPAWLYARLADALLECSPVPLAGATVLDAGAGTGVVGDAARAGGAAQVVGADLASAMRPDVVADLTRLPFRDDAFDLCIAGFVLGHVSEPDTGLRELRRVGSAVLASAFEEGWTHPAKEVVQQVLAGHGYRPPAWYVAFKDGSERRVGAADRLSALARTAGCRMATVRRIEVELGSPEPARLVAWRLGMAHHAPFLATLPVAAREAVRRESEERLTGVPPLVVPVLVLTVPAGAPRCTSAPGRSG